MKAAFGHFARNLAVRGALGLGRGITSGRPASVLGLLEHADRVEAVLFHLQVLVVVWSACPAGARETSVGSETRVSMSRSSLHSSLRLSLRSGSGKRFDTRRSLSLSRLIGSRRDATESTTLEPIALVHKVCPRCNYQWGDKYNKDECPKCLEPLSSPTISKRLLGEVSTPAGRQHPMSAMESYSGVCSRATDPDGGPHHWKFGKCVQCGKGEGEEA